MKYEVVFTETTRRYFTIIIEAPSKDVIWKNYDELYHIALTTPDFSDSKDEIEIYEHDCGEDAIVTLKDITNG